MVLNLLPQAEKHLCAHVANAFQIPVGDGKVIGRGVVSLSREIGEDGGDIDGMFRAITLAERRIVGTCEGNPGCTVVIEIVTCLSLTQSIGAGRTIVHAIHRFYSPHFPTGRNINVGTCHPACETDSQEGEISFHLTHYHILLLLMNYALHSVLLKSGADERGGELIYCGTASSGIV
jgi:hypothetical protein